MTRTRRSYVRALVRETILLFSVGLIPKEAFADVVADIKAAPLATLSFFRVQSPLNDLPAAQAYLKHGGKHRRTIALAAMMSDVTPPTLN